MWPKIKGGILTTVGFILSPLSWWNDLFVNLPLAYLFAYLVGLFNKNYFLTSVVVGYWLTNIIGLLLMHVGVKTFLDKNGQENKKNELLKTIAFSVIYTIAIVVLIKLGLISLPASLKN